MSQQTEKPKVYLANCLGFSYLLREYVLYGFLVPEIEDIGFKVLEPFRECPKYTDMAPALSEKDYDKKAVEFKKAACRYRIQMKISCRSPPALLQ
jgi:hypothetical protein